MENILLENVIFIKHDDGSIDISPEISTKLVDFGNAEIFKTDLSFSHNRNCKQTNTNTTSNKQLKDHNLSTNYQFQSCFICTKQHLSIDNEQYLSPNISQEDWYNAHKADSWSLGIILYYMLIGCMHIDTYNNRKGSGFYAIQNKKLKEWLRMNNLIKFVNPVILSLIEGLLNINENDRFDLKMCIKHKWFKTYMNKYQDRLNKKSKLQRKSLLKQKERMESFPFYS